MSVTDFFQYLLDHERSSRLGSELLAVYAERVELARAGRARTR
jgi:hypothetical protein